jgi:hypothetical protein
MSVQNGNLRKHHQIASFLVSILLRATPLFPDPLLTEEQLEKVVAYSGRREGPWTLKTGTIGMAATERVGTREGNDFLVIESEERIYGSENLRPKSSFRGIPHTVEDLEEESQYVPTRKWTIAHTARRWS